MSITDQQKNKLLDGWGLSTAIIKIKQWVETNFFKKTGGSALLISEGGTGLTNLGANKMIIGTGDTSSTTITASSSNVASTETVVKRDTSGNFSAGTITANLTGTATKASGMNSSNYGSVYVDNDGNFNVATASGVGGALYSAGNVIQGVRQSPPTFGTLPVIAGGTGLTASPSILVNLGSTSATSVLQSTPRPGVTGTLPVSHGGTGATTLQSGALLQGNGTSAVSKASSKGSSQQLVYIDGNGVAQAGIKILYGPTSSRPSASSVPAGTIYVVTG